MNSKNNEETHQICPICFNIFPMGEIETHVNKCIFLNSVDEDNVPKRKRSISPTLNSKTFNKPTQQPSCSKLLKKEAVNINALNKNNVVKENTFTETLITNGKCLTSNTPLAKQVQPKQLEDFFGQNHVLGRNSVLHTLLENKEIPNMILWGPPGCGKTSLASVVQEICKENCKQLKFVNLCAATSNLKEVTGVMTTAKNDLKFGKKTVLFMDEIHRFNKRQQDSFLIHVEKGEIILIGATTENPSFCINSALLSRCRVIVFEKLKSEDIVLILRRALRLKNIDLIDENGNLSIKIEKTAINKSAVQWLADISDGDARIALNNLELVLQYNNNDNKVITVEDIQEGIKKSHLLYDRKGEEHYNLISAVHKSIRSSDDNAALYWTTRMIMSGEDPLFIARRMVRAASEDIGNADPHALPLAVSTMQGCQLLGMPESDCLLAQCAIYLARAPKSREADSALAAAKTAINEWKGPQPNVPMHLRNAPTKLMKDLGYGRLEAGKERTCLPEGLENVNFFD